MSKYAIDYTISVLYGVNYVIEADDEDEARHLAEEKLLDGDFTYELSRMMETIDDGEYEIGEVLKLYDDTNAKTGEFFYI